MKEGVSMIKHIDITGIRYEVSKELDKYVTKKISKLDKFVPRHARKSLIASVNLEERKTKTDKYQCEVILHLPDQKITAKDSTVNMFAAVDIVETKLKTQLKKYKATHGGDKQDHHGVLRRFFRNQRNS
jgi:putative sigma-54 modulation protein